MEPADVKPSTDGPAERPGYVELRVATAFSFLRGASTPEELVERALALGYDRLAITDRDGLYGVVRAHRAAKGKPLRVLVGAELTVTGATPRRRRAPKPSPGLTASARGAASSAPGPGDTHTPGTHTQVTHTSGAAEPTDTLILLASDRASYGRLSRLLSVGKLRVGKGGTALDLDDVARYADGLHAIHVGVDAARIERERELFGDRLSIAIERTLTPLDRPRIAAAQAIAARLALPLVAVGSVTMHEPARKPIQDVLSAIRMGTTLEGAGRRLAPNGMAHLRSPAEVQRLFRDFPEAVARSVEIADALRFDLGELRHRFALELIPSGETPMGYLRGLVERGATERYPAGVPADVRAQIEHELRLVDELGFAGYFLTVWDIVRFARERGILCQGRGSAANSIICYVLGITSIDPVRMSLLFERFISAERGEPPDIDVDFEHERREEVIQYVFDKYGREHAAMVAAIITYRGRSAFREVGKVFGLGEDQLERLSALHSDFAWEDDPAAEQSAEDPRNAYWRPRTRAEADDLRRVGLDPDDHGVREVIRRARQLRGLPRHLGQHSGGVVIAHDPVPELFPVENATMPFRTVGSWDKDDLEALNMFKIDLLGLGMLSAVRRTFALVEAVEGRRYSLADIPAEDPHVYAMITDADTIGTFQVESRAQMQVLPKLRPRTFYDLVVSVAIIRPGPIQGDMVHPYLRRRNGEEAIEYPHPDLEGILGKTYGVPLFQEQVMKIAVKIAGFTGGEADYLRRAIGWNSKTQIDALRERLVRGMTERGVSPEYAERIFRMIQGFGGYGFPESHSASFALIAYASCYLKRYHPAAFLAAMLNSQPLGFYSPNTLIQDGVRHGVEVRPVSVLDSEVETGLEAGDEGWTRRWWAEATRAGSVAARHTPWADHVLREGSAGRRVQPAVRLGLGLVRGMSPDVAARIVEARRAAPPRTIAELVDRANIPPTLARSLATAGAFDPLLATLPDAEARREALWRVAGLGAPGTLFAGVESTRDDVVSETLSASAREGLALGGVDHAALDASSRPHLEPMQELELLAADYQSTGVSTRRHPMAVYRRSLARQGIRGYRDVLRWPSGEAIRVAGLVTTRQRPGTASGVVFITLEDEHGHMNLVVFSHVFERDRRLSREVGFLVAVGRVEREKGVTNVIVERFEPFSAEPDDVGDEPPVDPSAGLEVEPEPRGRYERFRW
jgi:error-prone DNA polymerase